MGFIQSSNSVHLQTCSKVVKVKTFCDFLLLLFFGRLLVQRERRVVESFARKKEATQIFGLRGFYYYSEHYFCTFVILLIRLLGCLSKAQFINQMPNLDYLGRPYNDP